MPTPIFLVTPKKGFPALERQSPAVARAISPDSDAPSVCCVLDGVLAEPRHGREIGAPIDGSMQWLLAMTTAGVDVYVYDSQRPTTIIWAWLQANSPTVNGVHSHLENTVQICAKRPPANVFLDASAVPFNGHDYPTADQIRDFRPWWRLRDDP
jgi:hypothetical protein